MSDRNPNVFYEVGYAHAKQKTCILLTADAADIPFDLKHQRHIVYGTSIVGLKQKLIIDLAKVKVDLEARVDDQIRITSPLDGKLLEASHPASLGRRTKPFSIIAVCACMRMTLSDCGW